MTAPAANAAPLWAAIDLGSNSFRLELAREDDIGRFERQQYLKEPVRLGGGLDEKGCITRAAMQRGWQCLAAFGQRLRELHEESGLNLATHARAVATQTLREARNADEFLTEAQRLLGLPIAVISGHEEAALIYRGVSSLLPATDERRVVVDIGGRSTEIITGQGVRALDMESYPVGSVTLSQRHFADGLLAASAFEAAVADARAALHSASARFGRAHWQHAYGASGTVGAVLAALRRSGRASVEGNMALSHLYWLRQRLIEAGSVQALDLPGIREERKAIIGGGLSLLIAVFEQLDMDAMHRGHGALRHGLFNTMRDAAQGD